MKDKIARERLDEHKDKIMELVGKLEKLENKNPIFGYIKCDNCGCLVAIDKATKKQEMVDNDYCLNVSTLIRGFDFLSGKKIDQEPDKIIKTTYLCKHCLKKKK
jgi:hypothetical protein